MDSPNDRLVYERRGSSESIREEGIGRCRALLQAEVLWPLVRDGVISLGRAAELMEVELWEAREIVARFALEENDG